MGRVVRGPLRRPPVGCEDAVDLPAGGGTRDDIDGADLAKASHVAGLWVLVTVGVDGEAAETGVVLGGTEELKERLVAGDEVELRAHTTIGRRVDALIVANKITDRPFRQVTLPLVVHEGAAALEQRDRGGDGLREVVIAVVRPTGAEECDFEDVLAASRDVRGFGEPDLMQADHRLRPFRRAAKLCRIHCDVLRIHH
ncbi:MAG: hypothetical protein ACR2JC_20870 [Chloroflexota bacterium]